MYSMVMRDREENSPSIAALGLQLSNVVTYVANFGLLLSMLGSRYALLDSYENNYL